MTSLVGAPQGVPSGDRARLDELFASLGGRALGEEARRFPRFEWHAPAVVRGWSGDGDAKVLDVSGGGLRLRTEVALEHGELAVVEIAVASGVRYALPVRIAWSAAPGSGLVGATFVGMPRLMFARLGSEAEPPTRPGAS